MALSKTISTVIKLLIRPRADLDEIIERPSSWASEALSVARELTHPMEMPTITLKNGLRVANFSSPHSFKFTTGEVLPACSAERATALMLTAVEKETVQDKWTDIHLEFQMSDNVAKELDRVDGFEVKSDLDVILVPLPVRQAIGWFCKIYPERARGVWMKTRCIRVADRVTKQIHPDRFCY
jgi:hypothetical protein